MIDLLAIARRRWNDRALYERSGDWLLSLYHRVLVRLRGAPLPFRERECAVRVRGARTPLRLRLATSDWHVLEELHLRNEYGFALQRAAEPRTILDLGANIGLSVRLWQETYPRAKVIAVEPDAGNMALCRKNVGPRGDVQLVEACAAAAPGFVSLDRSREHWAYSMCRSGGGGAIRAVTVPELLSLWGPGAEIDLLKCDIEGAEAEVFGSCRGWIHRVHSLVVEVHAPYTGDQLLRDVGPLFEEYRRVPSGETELLFLERRGARGERS